MIYYCRNVDKFKKTDIERMTKILPKEVVKNKGTRAQMRLSAVAYTMLLCGLRKEYNINNPVIGFNVNRKPYLVDYPDIHIGISHSAYMAAVVICDFPVGLDVELVQSVSDNVLRYSCSENEVKMVNYSSHREEMFCRLWTKKESTVKCLGATFKGGLKNIIDESRFDYETIIMDEYCLTLCKEKEKRHVVSQE